MTRNQELDESSAEWVLFLDDDVIPDGNILGKYAEKIEANPNASGFIGRCIHTEAETSDLRAVLLANITHFWEIAKGDPDAINLPWGITANLLARRSRVSRLLSPVATRRFRWAWIYGVPRSNYLPPLV